MKNLKVEQLIEQAKTTPEFDFLLNKYIKHYDIGMSNAEFRSNPEAMETFVDFLVMNGLAIKNKVTNTSGNC